MPQFYLRQWTQPDGRIVRYHRVPTGKICQGFVTPRGTGFEPDLYATPRGTPWEQHDPNIIETKLMSRIDNDAAPVLEKLIGGATEFAEQEKTAWSRFLNSLIHRHRDGILARDSFAPELAKDILTKLSAEYDDTAARTRFAGVIEKLDAVALAKTSHRTIMATEIDDSAAIEAVNRLTWIVLPVLPFLITTDRPLLVNLGRGGTLALMSIALCPTRLFVSCPPEWTGANGAIDGLQELLENLAVVHDLALIRQQPCRSVYAPRLLTDEWIVGQRVLRLRTAVERALTRWAEEPG